MKLENYLSLAKISKTNFAKRWGLSHPTFVRYNRGDSLPTKENIMRLMKLSNGLVQWRDFFREGTVEQIYQEDLMEYLNYTRGGHAPI